MSLSQNRCALLGDMHLSVSPFHGNGEPLYLFVFTQFRSESYDEVAEPDRFTLFLELL